MSQQQATTPQIDEQEQKWGRGSYIRYYKDTKRLIYVCNKVLICGGTDWYERVHTLASSGVAAHDRNFDTGRTSAGRIRRAQRRTEMAREFSTDRVFHRD